MGGLGLIQYLDLMTKNCKQSVSAGRAFLVPMEHSSPDQCLADLKFAVVRRSRNKDNRRETEHTTFPTVSLRANWNLTPRENELMKYFAQGLLYKEAADKMRISYAVVHKLQHKIFVKLRVSNKTEAISKWIGENGRGSRLATRETVVS